MSEHTNVHVALAHAQIEMGKLVKGSTNAAFKRNDGKPSTYADLADVVEAVRAPFANNGLAFFHTIDHRPELGMCLVTTLVHGKSGTFIDCPVPLIVDRNNMHGLKSAITYAKRIGVESVSGIAPEDDDGNAAAKAAPKAEKASEPKRHSSAEMKRWIAKLREDVVDVHTLVSLEALRADVEHGMAINNWPNRDRDSQDYETGFPKMARDILDECEERIMAAMDAAEVRDLREPNILMAGE